MSENLLNNADLRIIPHPRPRYPDFNLLQLHVLVGCSRPMLRYFIYEKVVTTQENVDDVATLFLEEPTGNEMGACI